MDCTQEAPTPFDFLQYLDKDISMYILSHLDDPADLARASSVSRFWRHFVITNGLSKKLCLRMFPQISNVVGIVKTTDEPMDLDNIEPEYDWKQKILEKEHVVYGPLLVGLTKSEISIAVLRASRIECGPISDRDESVIKILSPVDRSLSKTSCETRLYEVQPSTWVITHLEVEHAPPVVSSAKAVRVQVGYTQRELPNEVVWTYTSSVFPTVQGKSFQVCKLPEPIPCIDGFVQVEVFSRAESHQLGGPTGVNSALLGRQISPAFKIERLEPSEKLLLKYYLEKYRLES